VECPYSIIGAEWQEEQNNPGTAGKERKKSQAMPPTESETRILEDSIGARLQEGI
jgi:hypothetical protein